VEEHAHPGAHARVATLGIRVETTCAGVLRNASPSPAASGSGKPNPEVRRVACYRSRVRAEKDPLLAALAAEPQSRIEPNA
jgi:hypothetical protein